MASALPADADALQIWQRYPEAGKPDRIASLGNAGGFSGALLWRIDTALGSIALRAWPAAMRPGRLASIHALMRQARMAGLSYVPILLTHGGGATWVESNGRLWEASTWQPGNIDAGGPGTQLHLANASVALARLHEAWQPPQTTLAVCPAVARRLHAAADWSRFAEGGPPDFREVQLLLRPWVERGWHLLQKRVHGVPRVLSRWQNEVMPLQPCLCDIWRAHVLFDAGAAVTGIIDYGSVKLDHVAADLARLLGSWACDDSPLWQAGLAAYRSVRPLTTRDEELARVLDSTGLLLGIANWLLWIQRDRRRFADEEAAARRLADLVQRSEAQGESIVSAC